MLDNIYDDSIQYPFLEKNYNTIVKNFSFTPHGLTHQSDILWAIGESGSVKNRLLKKWLSYNITTQDQIKEVFEDIKAKKDLLIDKKYRLHLDNVLWSTVIGEEKNKFHVQDIFNLFVQFDDLQNTIQEDKSFSKKKYNNIFKKLGKIDVLKDITKDKLDDSMKKYPIKKGDFIDMIDTIISKDNITLSATYIHVRNFIESDIDSVYKTALEYPSYYDEIIDFTKNYLNKKIDHTYGQFQTDLDKYIQLDINSTSGGGDMSMD